MAQPYLISMEHSEWHARNVLKKFHKNRPLGRIHQHHRFNPPQPVLSCRTVDIDISGTRTYRPVSNRDIIEEQHRLIHEIYSKARSLANTPAESRPASTQKSEADSRSLSALQISGQYPGSRSSSRNSSAPQSRPTSSRSSKKTGFIVLKVRPHTTGSRRSGTRSVTESRLNVEPNPAFDETNQAYRTSSQLIKQTWEPENRALDQGKFVRGKKDGPSVSTSIDPKTGLHQWMSFGGGQKERSAGVVDAFTSTKEDKYFSIDGSTGTLVAKQLQRGDKIRVGRNGEVRPPGPTQQAWEEDNQSTEREEEKTKPLPPQILPLSWEEQMAAMDYKIIEAKGQKPAKQLINLCETHPVVFKKFGEDGMKPPPVEPEPKSNSVRVREGYNVQRRTADRICIDGKGERPSAKVTHISVSKDAKDTPNVNYEDVLDMKIQSKGAKGPHIHEELSKASRSLGKLNSASASNIDDRRQQQRKQQHQPHNPQKQLKSASKSSFTSEDNLGTARGIAAATKLHSSSMVSNQSEAENDLNGVVLAPRASPINPPVHSVSARVDQSFGGGSMAGGGGTPRKPATKSSGQSRPPPAKPVLHKTSAATGSSIAKNNSNNSGEETEFLHFAQQLSISRENSQVMDTRPSRVSSAGSRQHSAAAIQSVTEHNKPPSKDVTFKEEVEIAEVEDHRNVMEEDPNKYAFNIPTADEEAPQSP